MSDSHSQNITGTIVLAGAGKMGGAMLTGWLAGGLDARRVAVIEPHPSAEISALAAKGIRLNPSAKEIGDVATLVVAVKPQMFREAGPALKSFVGPSTLVVSIMAGTTIAALEASLRRQRGARDAEHAGRDRPRHHGRGRGEQCQRRAARGRRRVAARHRFGRMGR